LGKAQTFSEAVYNIPQQNPVNMHKRVALYVLLFLGGQYMTIHAQTIHSPRIDRVGPIQIDKIEHTDQHTVLYATYTASDRYLDRGWTNVSGSTYLLDRWRGKKYYILRAQGIPMQPERHYFDYAGQSLSFRLLFPRLPSNVSKVDLIECPDREDCFNTYGIYLTEEAEPYGSDPTHTGLAYEEEADEQDGPFREDYAYLIVYDPATEEWSELLEATTTVVFNHNENADVKMYYQSGEEEILRKVSAIEEIDMDDGSVTQAMKVVDQDGVELFLGLNSEGYMILVLPDGSKVQFLKE
jgi:hypothetical protein